MSLARHTVRKTARLRGLLPAVLPVYLGEPVTGQRDLFSLAVLISVVATISDFGSTVGYAFGVGLVVLGGVFARVAFIAHVRRVTCGVWLAAYEDALVR